MSEKLYILDMNNLINRAFYALAKENLRTSKGFPTGAIKGTLSMLLKIFKDHKPSHVLATYDHHSENDIRKKICSTYKENRGIPSEEFTAQVLIIQKILDCMGIKGIYSDEYEADDLIASAVKKFKQQIDIVVLTGDKDMLQLVDEKVHIYDSMKKTTYSNSEDVRKKFNVDSNQISEFLAIVGDTSDNIKGINGIGKVGASKLLKEYFTIDNIYNNIDNIQGSLKEKLIKSKDTVEISRKLTQLYDDVNLGFTTLNSIKFTPIIDTKILNILKELEFTGFEDQLRVLWSTYRL